MFRKMKNRKGFTLIELVVVIAILGILAAIAIPRLIGFTDKAGAKAAAADARIILTAYSTMVAEDIEVDLAADGSDIENDLAGEIKGTISEASNTDGAIDFTYELNGWTVTCDDGVLSDPS